MNTKVSNMLSKFGNLGEDAILFQDTVKRLLKAQKPPREETYKPAFSMGFRGATRSLNPIGRIPAPTIDQVRNIERAYLCKIHVKRGLMYFKGTSTAFTPERGAKYREDKMKRMLKETENGGTD